MKTLLDLVTGRKDRDRAAKVSVTPAEHSAATRQDAEVERIDHPVAAFFDSIADDVKQRARLDQVSCGGFALSDADGISKRVGGAATGYWDTGEEGFIPVRVGIQQLEDGSFQLGMTRAMSNPADRHQIVATGSAADMIKRAGPLVEQSFNVPLDRIEAASGVKFDRDPALMSA
ncbi:MAG: hypothetical protein Alpg2KO_27990 [Alphaproteobacteria bacterium]